MTRARAAILAVLAAADEPLTAQAVHALAATEPASTAMPREHASANDPGSPVPAGGEGGPQKTISFDPVTAYRALRWLEDHGHADSFVLNCAEHGTERYWFCRNGEKTHRHWFHCEACHCFVDLGACRLKALAGEYEKDFDLEVRTHTLYFTGLCAKCKAGKRGGAESG